MSQKKLYIKDILITILLISYSYSQNIEVKDIDGNIYSTVKIGNQIWITENYKAIRYSDGTSIQNVSDNKKWSKSKYPAYCWYGNDIKNKNRYGALYNWYAVNTGILAPKGWHVPTQSDWDTLVIYLMNNGYNYDSTINKNKVGKALAAKCEWSRSGNKGAVGNDLDKNNRSGFSALPAGFRVIFGYFDNKGNIGSYWWTDSRNDDSIMHSCALYFDKCYLDRVQSNRKPESMSYGFSVRILKDSDTD